MHLKALRREPLTEVTDRKGNLMETMPEQKVRQHHQHG